MNYLDLVRMSIKNITVEMTESRTLRTLLGGNNKTVSVSDLEGMMDQAIKAAPEKGEGCDKVLMVLHFVNGESLDFCMCLDTNSSSLVEYINKRIAA